MTASQLLVCEVLEIKGVIVDPLQEGKRVSVLPAEVTMDEWLHRIRYDNYEATDAEDDSQAEDIEGFEPCGTDFL